LSSKNILYYGTDEPLPERIPLCAGALALFYEQGDLRYIASAEADASGVSLAAALLIGDQPNEGLARLKEAVKTRLI
jgi:hypothetical protein